ncbi:MAG: dihydrofolate reductase family protein, partial [Actinomycetota bacterium]|nr:dihydrofolate reductase family protein [Actinomycetota bacterium]
MASPSSWCGDPPIIRVGGSSLIAGESFREEVSRLKEQPGRDILVSGSITLVGSLLGAGLLDELSLLVFPVVVVSGK